MLASEIFHHYSKVVDLLPVLLPGVATLAALLLSIWFVARPQSSREGKEPDWIPYWTPWFGHAYAYLLHNLDFLDNTRHILNGRTVMKFRLGPQKFYLVTGAQNVQAVLRNSSHIRYLSTNEMVYNILMSLEAVTKSDIAKFRIDTSGRSHIPLPSSNVPDEKRLWAPQHRIFVENLTNPLSVEVMTKKFSELFSSYALNCPLGRWETIKLYQFVQQIMVESSTVALCGSELLKRNPDFVKAYWDYDSNAFGLIFGIPKYLYPKAYNTRDAWHDMGEKWMRTAWLGFNWNVANDEWEPVFGTKFSRERVKFLKDKAFDVRSRVGMHLGTIWALNTNTIPIVGWALMEIIRDEELFKAIRAEAITAFEVENGTRKLDMNKLIDLPRLQSVYAETLRLHDSINITREVTEDMTLDGYSLKKGYLIQAPSHLTHMDESVWSEPGHPADEFWAERHIIWLERIDESGNITKVPEFSVSRRQKSFYPFGGGLTICPGRHMAKKEIMAAVAIMVVNFDIEFVSYLNMGGSDSKSDRGPKDESKYSGFGTMPPDREMQVRWKRI